MSLILAIEADRRQAALLASIGRRVGAELVIAPTAERGLEAIDGRVPDLILTSALLSPRDDAAIAARLRELDAAASHVQMLTIPVLAKAARNTVQPGGLLGKLRGATPDASPSGCDPSLFAEQVTEYLRRAAAERQAREDAHIQIISETTEPSGDEIVIEKPAIVAAEAVVVSDLVIEPPLDEAPLAAIVDIPEPSIELAPEPIVSSAIETIAEPSIVVAPEAPAAEPPEALAVEAIEPLVIEATEPLAIEATVPAAEAVVQFVPEDRHDAAAIETETVVDEQAPSAAEAIVMSAAPEPPIEPAPRSQEVAIEPADARVETLQLADQTEAEPAIEPSADAVAVGAALRDFEAALAEIDAADATASPTASDVPSGQVPAESIDTDVFERSADFPDADASTLVAWAELSRADDAWPRIEGLTAEPEPNVVADAAGDALAAIATPAETASTESQTLASAIPPDPRHDEPPAQLNPAGKVEKRRRTAKPLQDEWGLFDPDQCGFAALLQKLDELATSADDAA